MEKLDIPFSSQSTYEYVVEEALTSCAGGVVNLDSYYCTPNGCNSECVIQAILSNPVVSGSPHLIQQAKLRYLDLLLGGMDNEIFDLLNATDSKEEVDAMYAYMMNPSYDICDIREDFVDLDNPVDIPEIPILAIPNITVSNLVGSLGGCNKTALVGERGAVAILDTKIHC